MKDIEELFIKQPEYNSLFKEINENTIDYVKELCKTDYKNHSDYVDNVKVLRKRHKVMVEYRFLVI